MKDVHRINSHLVKVVFQRIILIPELSIRLIQILLGFECIEMDFIHYVLEELIKVSWEYNLAQHEDADVLDWSHHVEQSVD